MRVCFLIFLFSGTIDFLTAAEESPLSLNSSQIKAICGSIEVKYLGKEGTPERETITSEAIKILPFEVQEEKLEKVIVALGNAFLIKEKFALTAAHNLILTNPNLEFVRNGNLPFWQKWASITFRWQWEGQTHQAESKAEAVYIHPNWDPNEITSESFENKYDFAIIKLGKPTFGNYPSTNFRVMLKKIKIPPQSVRCVVWCPLNREIFIRSGSPVMFDNYNTHILYEINTFSGYSGAPVTTKQEEDEDEPIIAIHRAWESPNGKGLRVTKELMQFLKKIFPNS